MTIETILKEHFGFDHFRPGQAEIIEHVLAGQDVMGILPTGSGKTLCYQLPGQILGGTTIVIEPLLALMDDQVKRLQAQGEKRVIALTGRLQPQDFAQILSRLNQYQFIFLSPEMLANPAVYQALSQLNLQLAVVDEAHCISQWGPDFRPDYLKLGDRLHPLKPRSILALTATAPDSVQKDIVSGLSLTAPFAYIASVDRPNIFMGVVQVGDKREKYQRLLEMVTAVSGPKIIYFDRKKTAEQVAQQLQNDTGKAAAYYHAELAAHDRDLIQRQFMSDQLEIICATSAFGMGIDKADVRLVVHTFVPESLEDYSQAMGRAGRDGQKSLAVILLGPGDFQRAAGFAQQLPDAKLVATIFKRPNAYADFDDSQVNLIQAYIGSGFSQAQVLAQLASRRIEKQHSFDAVAKWLQTSGCRRNVLLQYFDSPLITHDDFCCGVVDEAVMAQLAPVSSVKKATPTDWSEIFAQIFHSQTAF
ncbi:RecQ family ATP-dependent DNA helicase [Lacticaseibacillus brantae]|uniref:ATP-dependent DNA helicase RecQ n=1 Tax=Lacticaseibacillus brantae DSM 23927 TaxID=1423727 RepID=A0A0R2B8Z0_9LACO|nr:RecQ family ATP-dependent DNA helicase [Lacticaseibacillus brantae]KRM72598.1 ATP-dependent DNA helicase RecQ [Lacticaseibacillus brantae DSM 23927]